MMYIAASILLLFALLVSGYFYLRGEDLRRYDKPLAQGQKPIQPPSQAHFDCAEFIGQQESVRPSKVRERMNKMGDDADLNGIELRKVDAGGVPAEWVLAEHADPDQRLLYIHGGGFFAGSPVSHRVITTKLSRITGSAVLAIDYRLIPEHPRLACVEDCQRAYRWILDHGPNGAKPVKTLFVAGDSAGGNLTLVTLAWARDNGLRQANAAVTLCPLTDGTLSGPSLIENLESDIMLKPLFSKVTRIPHMLLTWIIFLHSRIRPCDPRVSPAHGNLANLPPTLVQASEAEALLDDARRYVNKAQAQGSEVELQTWHSMLHVWHIFEMEMPEAKVAFQHIAEFLSDKAVAD